MAAAQTALGALRIENDLNGHDTSRRADIEDLAYRLWLERGSPVGSPQVDCFRAPDGACP